MAKILEFWLKPPLLVSPTVRGISASTLVAWKCLEHGMGAMLCWPGNCVAAVSYAAALLKSRQTHRQPGQRSRQGAPERHRQRR